MHEIGFEFSWWEVNKEMSIEMTSGINYEMVQNFRVSLDEKRKSNLKFQQVNSFLLFTFVLFPYRHNVILYTSHFS